MENQQKRHTKSIQKNSIFKNKNKNKMDGMTTAWQKFLIFKNKDFLAEENGKKREAFLPLFISFVVRFYQRIFQKFLQVYLR